MSAEKIDHNLVAIHILEHYASLMAPEDPQYICTIQRIKALKMLPPDTTPFSAQHHYDKISKYMNLDATTDVTKTTSHAIFKLRIEIEQAHLNNHPLSHEKAVERYNEIFKQLEPICKRIEFLREQENGIKSVDTQIEREYLEAWVRGDEWSEDRVNERRAEIDEMLAALDKVDDTTLNPQEIADAENGKGPYYPGDFYPIFEEHDFIA